MNASETSSRFRSGPLWIAVVAALPLGVLAAGVLFVTSSNRAQSAATAAKSSPPPAAARASAASAEELAAAPVANVTPFQCSASKLSVATAPSMATVSGLRTGVHSGYDRLVVQFSGRLPGNIEIKPQSTASFTGAPSGMSTRVAGVLGVKVLFNVADMHTAYSGARVIRTDYVGLREARVIEDFEGYVSLGLGVNGSNCYRAFVLSNPNRLVVDIQTA